MNEDERTVFQECIHKTTELFKRRATAEDWADNIIEGSNALKTPNQWKHFYAWLASPTLYNEEEVNNVGTLQSTTEQATIEDYPEGMKVETYKNGCETIVMVRNVGLECDEEDEKKED